MRAKLRFEEVERGGGIVGSLQAGRAGAQPGAKHDPVALLRAHAERGQERPASAGGEGGGATGDARGTGVAAALGGTIQEERDGARALAEERSQGSVRAHAEAAAQSGEETVGAAMASGRRRHGQAA